MDEAYVKNIQDDIKLACKTLEELGFDSLMVISSKDRHMELGSAKGRSFIEAYPDYFEEFVHYCKVKMEPQNGHSIKEEPNEKNLRVKVPAVVIGPGRKETKSLKRKVASKGSPVNKSTSEEAAINDALDDDFDDGDESGLEEESEIDQDQEHTIDTDKIVKRNSKHRKGKKPKTKRQNVIVKPAFEEAFKDHVKKSEKSKKPQELFCCDQCVKVYQSKKALIVHQRLHTGEAPFPCPTCGKRFRSSSLRSSHEAMHSTELKYTCDLCGKAFQWRGSFNAHKRNFHSVERRHICDICGSRFKDASVLRKHTLIHTGERNHHCEICGKAFMFSHILKGHLKTHGEKIPAPKRFSCGICSTKFTQRHRAVKHLNKQHPDHVPIIYMLKDEEVDEAETSE